MTKITKLLTIAALLLPAAAGAAGLGQINVMSSLGQHLHAEIDVLSVPKEDANSLLVRLATPEAYRQANVEYGGALRGLSVGLMQRPNGQLYVRVYSAQPVNEPFVNLLIEVSGQGSTLVRQYPILLDPPGYASAPMGAAPAHAEAQPAPPRAEVQPAPTRAETRPAPAPRAPAAVPATPPPAPAAATEYGPVKRGETLSRIAAKVKPDGISLDQMLIAILRANPDAFINNNINRLKAGAMLRIPDAGQLAELPRDKARQEVRVQISDWNRYRRKLADSAGPATEKTAEPGKRAAVRVKEGSEAGSKDVLKLSRGQPAGTNAKSTTERIQNLEEELIARDRALKDANARIQELEKSVKETTAKK